MRTPLTRRTFVSAAALGPLAVLARSLRAPASAEGFGAPDVARTSAAVAEYTFTQFHNQTATERGFFGSS